MTAEHRAPDDPADPQAGGVGPREPHVDEPAEVAADHVDPARDEPADVEPSATDRAEEAPAETAPTEEAPTEAAPTEEAPTEAAPAEAEAVDPGPTDAPTVAAPQESARAAAPPGDDAAAPVTPPVPVAPGTSSVSRSWRTIARALAPRATRAQVLAGLLCALLGFAFVVQVQQNRSDGLSSLRQDELVRILDEVTQRTEELEDQAAELRAQRAELATGSDTRRAAREAATERAAQQGILAGRLPAQGPGVVLTVRDPDRRVPALVLYNVLEELRNAGAEAVQVNDLRVTASTYVVDTADGVSVDGTLLEPPYRWVAIGDPDVIIPALNMPGGALAVVRGSDGSSEVEARDLVEVTAVRDVEPPRFATPAPATDAG
ncbi:DUF881 domain-containing protein [Actinotalea solisilvae]|uniref:DUF881 domain-containing protein n=1 Tax=Actinotalea solisilvae TaxID=2072922 RepID=UPI0018F10D4C|nr:DUF881 domain-containing protein [Actinotalea solisilvae]